MPIGKVWIYRRFIGVQGRESQIFVNFAFHAYRDVNITVEMR